MQKVSYLFILSLLMLLCSGCGTYHLWLPKGPMDRAGPVRELTLHPDNPVRLYASSENGGVWVLEDYTDEDARWRPLTDFLENLQTRGFAISAADPDFLVMGNGLGFLHISTDGGERWRKLDTPSFGAIRRIIADARPDANDYTFFVASSTGLFLVDAADWVGGASDPLQPDLLRAGEVTDLVRAVTPQPDLYLAVRNEGVYRSSDAGVTWDQVLVVVTAEFLRISRPTDDGTFWVKQGGASLFRGDASSASLSSVPLPAITCGLRTAANFFENCSDVGYRNPFGGARGDWCNSVAADPADPETVFVGQARLFTSLDGGGSFTCAIPDHEDHHDVLFVDEGMLIATDGGVYLASIDASGNVSRTRGLDQGLATMQFFRVGVNGNNAAGSVDHNGIQYTMDLDAEVPRWRQATRSNYGNNSLENDFVYADPRNPNRFFVLWRDEQILRLNLPYTAANGDLLVFGPPQLATNPYSRLVDGARNQQLNALNYPLGTVARDPDRFSSTLLMATFEDDDGQNSITENDRFGIAISKDANLDPSGGPRSNGRPSTCTTPYCYDNPVTNFPTWSQSHDNGNVPIVSIAFSPRADGAVYALDEGGRVLFKRDVNDDAEPWSDTLRITPNPGETLRQLLVVRTDKAGRLSTSGRITAPGAPGVLDDERAQEMLLAISHDHVYRRNLGRQAWVRLPFTLDANNKINAIAQHPSKEGHFFLATDRGVYETTNGGDRWRRFGIGLPNAPVMQLITDRQFLYAATFGRGLWAVDLETRYRLTSP